MKKYLCIADSAVGGGMIGFLPISCRAVWVRCALPQV